MSKRIAVLMGGLSAEREVSLVSGRAVAQALRGEGYDAVEIDAGRDLWDQLERAGPDVIFNALHGEWGEDGRVQGILDFYGKPYTHSGVMASALAMDKHRSKAVLKDAGITVAGGLLAPRETAATELLLTPPYVIKPNGQGSSVGIYIVEADAKRPPPGIADNGEMGEVVMAEKFAPGRELTVTVMDGRALAVTEIIPKAGWYDYEAKYAKGGSVHVVPAKLPEHVTALCLDWAERAHEVLGCRGVTRSDFRYDDSDDFRYDDSKSKKNAIVNKIVMLELNTQPGMTPVSLVPEQASYAGIGFGQLCRWIVEDASWPR